jgi:exodeoxyribonuclease VII small subunit
MASFEDQLAELEVVIARLEQGELTLDENVSLFERGVTLSNSCKAQLSEAERRIQVLMDPAEDGLEVLQDLEINTADEEDDDEEFENDEM